MPKLPLPKTIWVSNDEAVVPELAGAQMYNVIVNQIKNYKTWPGKTQFSDIGSSTLLNGLYWWKEQAILFATSATNIYKVNQAGGATDLTGDALSGGFRTTFATDGTWLAMADGGQIVITDGSANTIAIVDGDAPTTVSHVMFMDSYMIAIDRTNNRFYYSDVGTAWDPSTADWWDSLSFYTPEYQPDNLIAGYVLDQVLYLIGQDTIEGWYNDGVSPFSRNNQFTVDIGVKAEFSIVPIGHYLYFLDSENMISRVAQGKREVLSPPIDQLFETMTAVNDATAHMEQVDGVPYYVITFRTDNKTFALNTVTGSWINLGEWNVGTGVFDKYNCHLSVYAQAWEKRFVGSLGDDKIYQISKDIYQDAGQTQRGLIRTAYITYGENKYKKNLDFIIRALRGANGDTSNAQIRWRDEGGPWTDFMNIDLGEKGDYDIYTRFGPTGVYKARQYEIVFTDNSEFELVEIEEEIELLDRY